MRMNLQEWMTAIKEKINILSKLDLGYPQGENILLPVDKPSANKLQSLVDFAPPYQVLEFYNSCGGIKLPNIWNGYFIFSVEQIYKGVADSILPTKVSTSDYSFKILVFGSDGGGNLFAAAQNDLDFPILYLPHGVISNSTIKYPQNPKPKIISPDFYGFLRRLLADTTAFVENNQQWIYMDENLYK